MREGKIIINAYTDNNLDHSDEEQYMCDYCLAKEQCGDIDQENSGESSDEEQHDNTNQENTEEFSDDEQETSSDNQQSLKSYEILPEFNEEIQDPDAFEQTAFKQTLIDLYSIGKVLQINDKSVLISNNHS